MVKKLIKAAPVAIKGYSFDDVLKQMDAKRIAYEQELSQMTPEQQQAKIAADSAALEKALAKYHAAGGAPLVRIGLKGK